MLYKVEHYYNEAVLRAFELEMGVDVIRPDIAGLMGAYGAALYGKAHTKQGTLSSMLSKEELEAFTIKTQSIQCQGCGNHCQLTINTFHDGKNLFLATDAKNQSLEKQVMIVSTCMRIS